MRNNCFVFDTNVLLSALLNENSNPAKAYNLARKKGAILVSKEISDEYLDVFSRGKFEKYAPLPFKLAFIEKVINSSIPVIINTTIKECIDPKDDKYLTLAVNGNAVCIITGDNHLLERHPFRGIPILKPIDFLNEYKIT